MILPSTRFPFTIRSFVGWSVLSCHLPLRLTILPVISCRVRMGSLISVVWFWFPLSSFSFPSNSGIGAWMPTKVLARKGESKTKIKKGTYDVYNWRSQGWRSKNGSCWWGFKGFARNIILTVNNSGANTCIELQNEIDGLIVRGSAPTNSSNGTIFLYGTSSFYPKLTNVNLLVAQNIYITVYYENL